MFEEDIFTKEQLNSAKSKLIQIPMMFREKMMIVRSLNQLDYTGNFSAGVRDLLDRYMEGEAENIPKPNINLEEINQECTLKDCWMVIRVSRAFKDKMKEHYRFSHRGENAFILSVLREILGYKVVDDVIVRTSED